MSKSRKLLLGIISFMPIALFIGYLIAFFSFFIDMLRQVQREDVLPAMIIGKVAWMVAAILLLALCSLGLLIYFIIHALNNKALDSTERLIWILVFIFAGMISFPVYWYMRIWTAPVIPA